MEVRVLDAERHGAVGTGPRILPAPAEAAARGTRALPTERHQVEARDVAVEEGDRDCLIPLDVDRRGLVPIIHAETVSTVTVLG